MSAAQIGIPRVNPYPSGATSLVLRHALAQPRIGFRSERFAEQVGLLQFTA
jgi:hypothetical protein